MTLYAVILAGGSGTRFWPHSRQTHPKQFLNLDGTQSLLQHTVQRVASLLSPPDVHIVTAAHLLPQTLAQVPALPPGNILSEPVGRNTAAAVGLAALHLLARDPEALMAILPADHLIPDGETFCACLSQTADIVRQQDVLMTLGVRPTYPATGYGYIEAGPPLAVPNDVRAHHAPCFIEKPPDEQARRLLLSGRYYWNCGIFLWRVTTILNEIERYLPELWHGLHTYVAAQHRGDGEAVLREHYSNLPSISIDHGVLEPASRVGRVGVVPVSFAWSDVGSWRNLADLHPPDSTGNVVVGEHLGYDSTGLIVYSPDTLVATIGLSDLIIVRTPDVLLICPKDRDQDIRQLVNLLQQRGQTEYL